MLVQRSRWMLVVGIKQDAGNMLREFRIAKKLWQIIDKMRTAKRCDSAELGFFGRFEKGLLARESNSLAVENPLASQPCEGSFVQIVFWAQIGKLCFMADNKHRDARLDQSFKR